MLKDLHSKGDTRQCLVTKDTGRKNPSDKDISGREKLQQTHKRNARFTHKTALIH